jgi:hypothetical protein
LAVEWAANGDREAMAAVLTLTANVMKLADTQPAKSPSCAACGS